MFFISLEIFYYEFSYFFYSYGQMNGGLNFLNFFEVSCDSIEISKDPRVGSSGERTTLFA